MSEDGKDGVIDFPQPEKPPVRFEIKRGWAQRDGSHCMHRSGCIVDPEDRIVECRACGRAVDAFDQLLDLARDEATLYRRDVEARQVDQLLAELSARGLRIRWPPGGRNLIASALGQNGQRIEARGSTLNEALFKLRGRLAQWGDRDLEYPRFTITRSRGKQRIGILDGNGGWSLIAEIDARKNAYTRIREEALRRGVKPIIEDRPQGLWDARPLEKREGD